MLLARTGLKASAPALAASIPIIIIPITVLSIMLAAAQSLHLSSDETTTWILSLYGLSGLLSLAFAFRYKQPLILTGNVFALTFYGSLGGQVSFPELIGASILAGVIVLLIAVFDLTERLAAWVPAPIVLGLLAGAILPYVAGVFTALRDEPIVVGGTFLAFLLGRRLLGGHVSALLPALVVGLILAGATGQLGGLPANWSPPGLVLTSPVFTLHGIATVTPVLVILMVVQSNLPSAVYLRSQGYRPPEKVIDGVGGVATALGSLFGPNAQSLALPLVSLAAAPDAGELGARHRSVYIVGAALIVIALLAGAASMLPMIIPIPLLLALAGLALVPVLTSSLQAITRGPLVLGPLFAFAVAMSKISFFGLGPFFWAFVIGLLASLLLERKEMGGQRISTPAASQPAEQKGAVP